MLLIMILAAFSHFIYTGLNPSCTKSKTCLVHLFLVHLVQLGHLVLVHIAHLAHCFLPGELLLVHAFIPPFDMNLGRDLREKQVCRVLGGAGRTLPGNYGAS